MGQKAIDKWKEATPPNGFEQKPSGTVTILDLVSVNGDFWVVPSSDMLGQEIEDGGIAGGYVLVAGQKPKGA